MDSARYRAREDDPAAALSADLARAAVVLFSAGTVTGAVARVAGLAVSAVGGCDFACVFLRPGEGLAAPAHAGPLAVGLEALQRDSGEGPCLDAAARDVSVHAEDLGSDARWPRFGPRAAAAGTRSLLALPLAAGGTQGVLCLCARRPGAFGISDRARGLLLAALAGPAFASAHACEDQERRAADLRSALATREVIGQAEGILMERERVTAGHAFDILRRSSQHLNLKLRDVAQALVDTGQTPGTVSVPPVGDSRAVPPGAARKR
jgi:hypothetical protein